MTPAGRTITAPLLKVIGVSRIDAIKIGLVGAPDQVQLLVRVIRKLGVPVVIDPVLRAGGGGDLASAAVQQALVEQLMPLATVSTPNAIEARRLAGRDDTDASAAALLAQGCASLLITGGDEPTPGWVHNQWHVAGREPRRPSVRLGCARGSCGRAAPPPRAR